MSTHADFHLHTEAVEELKRLAAHPGAEVARLADEAREGETAASLGIVVAAVFLGVWGVAAVLFLLVLAIAALFS